VKIVAPGKVLLFGAYSVLEGTPALVVAVDRYAVADTARLAPSTSREIRAAIGDAPAPELDLTSLYEGTEKLGLGSSAAALVATLGARAAERGEDLALASVRHAIFSDAKRAHAEAQGGGSGVDIAASTYGGAIVYRMSDGDVPAVRQTSLPRGLALRVLWSGKSARTSVLVAKVRTLQERDDALFRRCIGALGDCVEAADRACDGEDVSGFVAAGQANARALASLGAAADAPIVPPAFADLARAAEREGGAFYPSGAGGGDVGVWLGRTPPSADFLERAKEGGMSLLDLAIDPAGLRRCESADAETSRNGEN
jgi:phosphomevalonate kinase